MEESFDVKLIVAAHRPYRMPADPMYLPLHVGAAGKPNFDDAESDPRFVRDDTGENISALNPEFCELTGLYWGWKNLQADYVGLVHYRRHFGFRKTKDPMDGVLTREELAPYLGEVRLFVPKKRRYYIETLYSHYAHTHMAEQLDETRRILEEKYPDVAACFNRTVRRRSGYMFNMMIMDRALLDDYCTWLFDVLFELRLRIDTTGLSPFQLRFFGRVSEIIFNVWLTQQTESGALRPEEIMEIPCVYLEKVNWWKKGTAFVRAKFFGKKYESSF